MPNFQMEYQNILFVLFPIIFQVSIALDPISILSQATKFVPKAECLVTIPNKNVKIKAIKRLFKTLFFEKTVCQINENENLPKDTIFYGKYPFWTEKYATSGMYLFGSNVERNSMIFKNISIRDEILFFNVSSMELFEVYDIEENMEIERKIAKFSFDHDTG